MPAHDEQAVLPGTLLRIRASLNAAGVESELIVVDNASEDATAEVARGAGAKVLFERTRNIAAVRNAGAKEARGEVLVFIDADTAVPETLFSEILHSLGEGRCFGGAVAVDYADLQRTWMRWYLAGWKFWAAVFHVAQGAAQFVRRDVFAAVGGYDEGMFMGEDLEFYRRMHRYARRHGGYVEVLDDGRVVTSGRRFNKMRLWRVLVLTHPVFIRWAGRRKQWWRDWYDDPLR